MANLREFLEKNTIFNEHPVSPSKLNYHMQIKFDMTRNIKMDILKGQTEENLILNEE